MVASSDTNVTDKLCVHTAWAQKPALADVPMLLTDFKAKMQQARGVSVSKGKGIELKARIEIAAPLTGFSSNDVGRLLLTFGRRKNCAVPLAIRITVERLGGSSATEN